VVHVFELVAVAVDVDDAEGGVAATEGPHYGAGAAVDVVGFADVVTVCEIVAPGVFLDGVDVAMLTPDCQSFGPLSDSRLFVIDLATRQIEDSQVILLGIATTRFKSRYMIQRSPLKYYL